MKKIILILALVCCAWTTQAQDSNLKKTIEEGIKTSIKQTENREWKEAFATCRQMDALIYSHEQKSQQQAPDLHYLVTKERLRMYMRLNNADRSKAQIDQLDTYTQQAKNNALSEDLLMTKAGYYQKFGMLEKSLQCYKQLIQKRSEGEDETGINQCYQDMIAQAKQDKNTYLNNALEKLYTNWQDSIQRVKAAQAFATLQEQHNETQTTLQEKEEKIGMQQGIIAFLCILAAALAGGLFFFIGAKFKSTIQIKKLKNSLSLANDNNEMKSNFIGNISEQVAPSLDAIQAATADNPTAIRHITALKNMMNHIQTYMELETCREERYEVKDINVSSFCEKVMEKARENFKSEVEAIVNVPRTNIRTNAEALENILLYLLDNAALNTESGKITLEFKKRSAHSGQFIVTDTGSGIPEEKRFSLFKPFAEIQDLTKGDGLGLPTCALIAYKLNGTLRLDEEYKKGTRFVLELHS